MAGDSCVSQLISITHFDCYPQADIRTFSEISTPWDDGLILKLYS